MAYLLGHPAGVADNAAMRAGTDTRRAATPAGAAVIAEKYSIERAGAVGDGVTDDGPAINDAITTVSAAGGGDVWFPDPHRGSHYNIVTPLRPRSNVHWIGAGGRYTGQTRLRAPAGPLILGDQTVYNMTLKGLDLRKDGAAAGHLWDMAGFALGMVTIEDVSFIVAGSDTASVLHTGGGDAIELHVAKFYSFVPTTTTVPGWNLVSNNNAINVVTFKEGRFENSGDYAVNIETAGTGYCQDIRFSDVNFQQCLGGEVRLRSCRQVTFDGCAGYDATTYTKDRYRVEKSATGSNSSAIRFIQVARRNPGALGAGIADIRLVGGQSGSVTFDRCNGTIDHGGVSNVVILGDDFTSPAVNHINMAESVIRLNSGHVNARRFNIAGTAGEGMIEFMAEQSVAPAAPPANGLRLFTRDTAGKTELCAQFGTGTPRVIVAEL